MLGNKLWLSKITVEALDADSDVACCAVKLFSGPVNRVPPLFRRVRTALSDYEKETAARPPSLTMRQRRSSLGQAKHNDCGTGAGFTSVYQAHDVQGYDDGRPNTAPAPSHSRLGIDSSAPLSLPTAALAAATASEAITFAPTPEVVVLPSAIHSETPKASVKKARSLRFWAGEASGENPVCQLARSCHRPQTQAEKTAQQSPATGWLQKLDHHRHRSSRWDVAEVGPEEDEADSKEGDEDEEMQEKPGELTYFQAHQFAKQLNLPAGQVTDAWRQFKRYDSGNRGILTTFEFQLLLRSVLKEQYPKVSDIPRELFMRSNARAKDTSFPEFLTWISEHAFSEALLLTAEQKSLRAKARELGVSIPLVENIKQLFDTYDIDSNNLLDYSEFQALFNKLMGNQSFDTMQAVGNAAREEAKNTGNLPDARCKSFWMMIEGNRNGEVDFNNFMHWYLRYFDKSGLPLGASPLEDYYESIRPAPKWVTTGQFD